MYRDVQRLLYQAEDIAQFSLDQSIDRMMNNSLMPCDGYVKIATSFSYFTPSRMNTLTYALM
jgi:hypothetical protein